MKSDHVRRQEYRDGSSWQRSGRTEAAREVRTIRRGASFCYDMTGRHGPTITLPRHPPKEGPSFINSATHSRPPTARTFAISFASCARTLLLAMARTTALLSFTLVVGCESRLLPPFTGATAVPSPPSPPPQPLTLKLSARPRLKLRKRLGDVTVACARDVSGGPLSVEASCPAPSVVGGQLNLAGSTAEWRRMWLLPGLADAATKITLLTHVDLRTGHAHGEVSLGLRRKVTSSGLRLVHRQCIGGPCHVDIGATLALPNELRITTSGGTLCEFVDAARVEVDVDQAEICLAL